MDIQQRVWAAADDLDGEGTKVTVAEVRDRARCSMADATRHLRTWRIERAAQDAAAVDVPAMPAVIADAAERSTAALWGSAVRTARQEHDAAQAAARTEVEQARLDADDLAAQVDAAEQARAAAQGHADEMGAQLAEAKRAHAAAVQALTAERDSARDEAVRFRAEADAARQQAADARSAQAAAEGKAAGLREAFDRLDRRTK